MADLREQIEDMLVMRRTSPPVQLEPYQSKAIAVGVMAVIERLRDGVSDDIVMRLRELEALKDRAEVALNRNDENENAILDPDELLGIVMEVRENLGEDVRVIRKELGRAALTPPTPARRAR